MEIPVGLNTYRHFDEELGDSPLPPTATGFVPAPNLYRVRFVPAVLTARTVTPCVTLTMVCCPLCRFHFPSACNCREYLWRNKGRLFTFSAILPSLLSAEVALSV